MVWMGPFLDLSASSPHPYTLPTLFRETAKKANVKPRTSKSGEESSDTEEGEEGDAKQGGNSIELSAILVF